jgi:hypothetical protein
VWASAHTKFNRRKICQAADHFQVTNSSPATVDGQMVPTGQRARITSIQAEGAAGSKIHF